MKIATMPATDTAPAACPPGSVSGADGPQTGVPAPDGPGDEAQKRAIATAVWTDLLWLMPPDRMVTIAVTGGDVAVELGPPGAPPEAPAH